MVATDGRRPRRGTARPPGAPRWPHLLALLLVFGIANPAVQAGTEDDGGLWLAALGQGALAPATTDGRGLRWWLDLQARWRDGAGDLDTVIIRPAVGYALTPRVTVFAGYAHVVTQPAGTGATGEHRPWQQLAWTLPFDTLTLASRTRLEQRFIAGRGETGWRLRQFVRVSRPLGTRRYATAWDEAFIDLNDTGWGQRAGLRQNRAFAGVGWFIDAPRRTAVEVGYLNQWLDRPGGDRLNHILSINLFINR